MPGPPPPPRADDEAPFPVAVAVFAHAVEAHLARAHLAAEGIEAELRGEHTAGLLVGVHGVSVVVPAPDADRARALLAPPTEQPRRDSEDWLTDDLDAPRCPACGSLRVSFERLIFPLPGLRRRARCERCGHGWREDPA